MIFFDFLLFNVVIIAGSITLFRIFRYKLADYSLIVSLLIGLLFYLFFPDTIDFAIVVLGTLSINTLYSRNSYVFIAILIFLTVLDGALNFSISPLLHETLSLGVGISISLLLSNSVRLMNLDNENERGKKKRTEVERDVVQIFSGIIILLAIIFIPKVLLEGGLLLAILISIVLVNVAAVERESRISKAILHFERNNVQPGVGSLWFIAGLMILIALSLRWRVVEIGVFAMAIGDSLATIGGVNLRTKKLFYNHKKSIGGFLFMLIPTAIFAFAILGPLYVLLAVVATFAESISRYPVDDNISIPLSVIAVNLLISLL